MNPFEEWLGTDWTAAVAVIALLLGVSAALFVTVRVVVLPLIGRSVRKTSFRWDDVLAGPKVQRWLALFVPAIVFHLSVTSIPGLSPFWTEALLRVTAVAAISLGALALASLLMAFNRAYETLHVSRVRPIKGYLQVAQVVIYLFADLWALAVLVGQSPWFFLSGLGAAAAVLLILYRDSVLSLIASMQLAQNDMIRVGDWIEMPQYNADGTVVDMALATVKVENWDKTITTIPTHRLTSESFKNWRGIKEAGCWRIKRSINLDLSSIRFLTEVEAVRLRTHDPHRVRLDHIDADTALRGPRKLTNLDAFQRYVVAYLERHPGLATSTMPCLVRQLPPGPQGLPVEIYVFALGTNWRRYESIQGEIIGHVLAAVDQFDLRLFQAPADATVKSLAQTRALELV